MSDFRPMTKPGYKTTEFYGAIAAALAAWITAISGNLPEKYAALTSAIVAGLYAISRGLAKVGPTSGSP